MPSGDYVKGGPYFENAEPPIDPARMTAIDEKVYEMDQAWSAGALGEDYMRYAEKNFSRATLATGPMPERWMVPYDIAITNVRITAWTPSSSGSIVADINVASGAAPNTWTSLYELAEDQPTLAASSYGMDALLPETLSIAKGDFLSVDLDSIGTGASNVTVSIGYEFFAGIVAQEPITTPEEEGGGDSGSPAQLYDLVRAHNPIGYWRFDENTGPVAFDSSDNARHGEYTGEPTYRVLDVAGQHQAVSLSKDSADYVAIPYDESLDTADTFSIECLLKRNNLVAAPNAIVGRGVDSFALSLTTGGAINLRKWDTANICTSTTSITDTNWHHLVVTKNGADVKMYLDNADVTGAITDATIVDNFSDLWWGLAQDSGGGEGFGDVSLDEAVYYATVLSPADVAAHYASIPQATLPPPLDSLYDQIMYDNPLGYWRMDETTGTTVGDETTNDLDLTLLNTPTLGRTGAFGNSLAIMFAGGGANEYANTTATPSTGDTITVVTWVKRIDLTSTIRYIFSSESGQGSLTMAADGTLHYRKRGDGQICNSTIAITDLNWHQIAIVKDGGASTKIYIDKVDRTGTVTNRTLNTGTGAIYWGFAQNSAGVVGYGGVELDDSAVYTTALPLSRIEAQYDAAVAVPPPPAEGTYADEVHADFPVLYLRLGESSGTVANDASPNNLDGAYVNTPTLGVAGAVSGDTAVVLARAQSEYVAVPDSDLLDLGDVLSYELCFKRASIDGVAAVLMSKGANGLQLYMASTGAVYANKVGTGDIVGSTVSVTDTNWHHLVFAKNGVTSKMYIDGVDRTGAPSNQTLLSTSSPLHVGTQSATPASFWNGSIDEVAVYATALSLERVQAHYAAMNL